MSGMKSIRTCVLFVAAAMGSYSASAHAQSCASVLPSSPEIWATGDVEYEQLVTNDLINTYWSYFAMEAGDWDEGWGYSDPGNVNLPLARAFNAMYAVHLSAPPGAGIDNFLTTSFSFVVNSIDEIQTSCETNNPPYARTQWGFWVNDWTRLYLPFFYEVGVPVRAGTLVHEARHANEVGHNGGTGCPRTVSCDTNWGYNGANVYQVQWLSWFAYTAVASSEMRTMALDRANAILATGFNTDPGFRF